MGIRVFRGSSRGFFGWGNENRNMGGKVIKNSEY